MLKPQSIRKGVTIYVNGKQVEKQEVIDLSKDWTPNQETLFKKTLKQGGDVKINNIRFKITPPEVIVNSKGEKDTGVIVVPGADQRF